MKSRHQQDHNINPQIATALKQLTRKIWDHRLEDLASMNVLSGKVPGVELVFQNGRRPILSLAADFNSQLILERIKELKMQEDDDDDDSGDDYM